MRYLSESVKEPLSSPIYNKHTTKIILPILMQHHNSIACRFNPSMVVLVAMLALAVCSCCR